MGNSAAGVAINGGITLGLTHCHPNALGFEQKILPKGYIYARTAFQPYPTRDLK